MRKNIIHVGVEHENFNIDCRSLFGVGPADIVHFVLVFIKIKKLIICKFFLI